MYIIRISRVCWDLLPLNFVNILPGDNLTVAQCQWNNFGIWADARVCLHYWVVIWVAGYCNPPTPPPPTTHPPHPLYCTVLGYVMDRIHMALRLYSVLDILLPPIIIIMQECSQALKTCKRLQSLSCGGVSNMLLVLSITFVIKYICGCMCSTDPFRSRWLKGYIHCSCYYHYQIEDISLPHCYHIFCGRVSEMLVASYSVTYCIYIPGKLGFLFTSLLCSLW